MRFTLTSREITSCIVAIACSFFVSVAGAAERSAYSAGAIKFSHQLLPTRVTNDFFVHVDDVNGDGYTDFVLTGYTPTSMQPRGAQPSQVYLNNGDNTFKAATGDGPPSEWAREMLVADFNGDNIKDLFFADHGWDAAPFPGFKNQLLLGTATGFTDATDQLPDLNDFSHNAAAGDIDQDGDIDILVTNNPLSNADERSYFLMNDGAAHFTLDRSRLPASFAAMDPGQWSWAVELADLDNDGWDDLIVGRKEDASSWPSRIHWNLGNGTFSDTAMTNLPDMANFVSGGLYAVIEVQAFDVDNDGDKDVLLSAYDAGYQGLGIQLFTNGGSSAPRTFVDQTQSCLDGVTQLPDAGRDTPFFFRSMDINYDGLRDIVAFGGGNTNHNDNIVAFENTGGDRLRAITAGALTSDEDVRYRVTRFPLRGANEF